jgi:hypothetical protein
MKYRCQPKFWVKFPAYEGCTLSEEFEDFQYFTNWHREQVGYESQDFALDKDLLFSGNKMYHPDRCLLIPRSLNTWAVASKSKRGPYPQGVTASGEGRNQPFAVRVKDVLETGRRGKFVGRYYTVAAAVDAYCKEKDRQAMRWVERFKNKEFTVDERLIAVMEQWNTRERYGYQA